MIESVDYCQIDADGRSLSEIPTRALHAELMRREGVTAVFLGPEDVMTKTVRGTAWVIVNRD